MELRTIACAAAVAAAVRHRLCGVNSKFGSRLVPGGWRCELGVCFCLVDRLMQHSTHLPFLVFGNVWGWVIGRRIPAKIEYFSRELFVFF